MSPRFQDEYKRELEWVRDEEYLEILKENFKMTTKHFVKNSDLPSL